MDCPLNTRERDVLCLLAEGKAYKEIAAELGLSVSTIRTHLHNTYPKLGVTDRAHAVILTHSLGWIEVDLITELPRPRVMPKWPAVEDAAGYSKFSVFPPKSGAGWINRTIPSYAQGNFTISFQSDRDAA